MIKIKNIAKIVCATLCLLFAVLAFSGCSGIKKTKDGRLDYFNSKMSKMVIITPDDYNGLVATLPESYLVTDEIADQYIKNMLFANKKELDGGQGKIDQAIKYGDAAYIFYEGFVDGVAFSGGSNMSGAPANPYRLEIGSGNFIDDFEEQLIGIVPNQTSQDNRIEVKVTFPESYPQNQSMAGKEATFLVYVTKVVQYEIPELNSDTIKNILKYEPKETEEAKIVDEYRKYVKNSLETANESGIRSAAVENLLGQLLEKAEFKKIPEAELEYYKNMYVQQYISEMNSAIQSGYSYDNLDDYVCGVLGLEKGADWESHIEVIYTKIIKEHLVCHAIAQIEGVEVTDDDYENEIEYYIMQAAYQNQTLTRDDVVETIGEYTIRENAMYSKICSMLYQNAEIKYA